MSGDRTFYELCQEVHWLPQQLVTTMADRLPRMDAREVPQDFLEFSNLFDIDLGHVADVTAQQCREDGGLYRRRP